MRSSPPYLFPGLLFMAGVALIGAGMMAILDERRAMQNMDADLDDDGPEIDTPHDDIAIANACIDSLNPEANPPPMIAS